MGESSKGKDFQTILPNSSNRYIDYELRYNPATDDVELFIDEQRFASRLAGKQEGAEKRRGVCFGVQKGEGKARFALVEWKVADEAPASE
jgi:hypothetical protein